MIQIRNVPPDALHRKLKALARPSRGRRLPITSGPRWNDSRHCHRVKRCSRGSTVGTRVTLKTSAASVIREERESA